MIVDTSALVAALRSEPHWEVLLDALLKDQGFLPTPVIVEFRRVTSQRMNVADPAATALLAEVAAAFVSILPFDFQAAQAAVDANPRFGTGGGLGGPLNMTDLIVYGVAKTTGRPILCTGKNFIQTDATIHPASRHW